MDDTPETPIPDGPPQVPVRALRLPSLRASAVLAAVMLAVGVTVGAAIGPAPNASFAGGAGLAERLPALLASIIARENAGTSAPASAAAQAPPASSRSRRRRRRRSVAKVASSTTLAGSTAAASNPSAPSTPAPSSTGGAKKRALPAITSVWLIELSGGTVAQALAQPSATPYIDGVVVPASTLLRGWSALAASTFASDAALAEPAAPGAPPPLLHSIVQPPCPEGDTRCAPETAGQLTAADEFLKATLAQITTTAAYREHGLVVITFATVGIAAQAGLPAGSSNATLTSVPPAGAVLMSPFARAGARPQAAFDTTSPRQSLEALLR